MGLKSFLTGESGLVDVARDARAKKDEFAGAKEISFEESGAATAEPTSGQPAQSQPQPQPQPQADPQAAALVEFAEEEGFLGAASPKARPAAAEGVSASYASVTDSTTPPPPAPGRVARPSDARRQRVEAPVASATGETVLNKIVIRAPSGKIASHPWQVLRPHMIMPLYTPADEAKALSLIESGDLRLFTDEAGALLRHISPSFAAEERLHYELDDRYYTTLVVREWPKDGPDPIMWRGIFVELAGVVPGISVSLHAWRPSVQASLKDLRSNMERLELEIEDLVKGEGLNNPVVQGKMAERDDLESKIRSLARSEETIFHVSCYIRIGADSLDQLRERIDAVEEWGRSSSGITMVRVPTEQRDAYVGSMPFSSDPAYLTRPVTSDYVARMVPFISAPHIERNETQKKPCVLYGIHMANFTPVIASPWNQNETIDITTVLGAPGAGKSYWVRCHIGRLAMLGVQTITIDPLGDFVSWHERNEGQIIEIGTESPIHINPLRRTYGIENIDGIETRGVETIDAAITRLQALFRLVLGDEYDIVADGLIGSGLRALYERFGEEEPLMVDFINTLKEVASTEIGALGTETMTRQSRLVDTLALLTLQGQYKEFFTHKTNVVIDPQDPRSQKICFNLKPVGDNPALLPFAVYLAVTMARNVAKSSVERKILIIDEIHKLFQVQRTAEGVTLMLQDLTRTHRHWNTALTFATQFFDKDSDTDRNKSQASILALTKSWVLLRATPSMLEQTMEICHDIDPSIIRLIRVVGEVKSPRGQPTPAIFVRTGEVIPMYSVGLEFEDKEDDKSSGVYTIRAVGDGGGAESSPLVTLDSGDDDEDE